MIKKNIAILGSTGSIGDNIFRIIKKDKKKINILLLSANKNYKKLFKQAKKFNVKNLIITDRNIFNYLIKKKNLKYKIFNNFENLDKIFKKKLDYTMCGIAGLDGLKSILNIIKYTKKIAIANKEPIICAWHLIKKELLKYKVEFIPVDSEHFSIWFGLNLQNSKNINKIYLTASGGPFLNYKKKNFKNITVLDALNHPNWKMGNKISVDSATMMNKVFEVIEANKIFKLPYSKIDILIHPKSYIHAILKFNNGMINIVAHNTSMIIPIFNSIYENKNLFKHFELSEKNYKLDLSILNSPNFMIVDKKKFQVIEILESLEDKDTLFETALISANDTLVDLFLKKKIKFYQISRILLKFINSKPIQNYKNVYPSSIQKILDLSQYIHVNLSKNYIKYIK